MTLLAYCPEDGVLYDKSTQAAISQIKARNYPQTVSGCKVYPFFVAMAALKGDKERNRNHIPRHAKIGNDCILGSKASVIGPVTIGDDVTIAACAIVTKDVPSHSVVKGLNQIRPKRPEEIPDKYKVRL